MPDRRRWCFNATVRLWKKKERQTITIKVGLSQEHAFLLSFFHCVSKDSRQTNSKYQALSAVCLQKLKVLFAVGSDGEVSEPLEVNALSCDTVEQVKEKILTTFKAKFGFSYSPHLRELWIGKDPAGFPLTYKHVPVYVLL